MKIDKTELFNVLTVIATLILTGGGNLFELDFGSVPGWAIPIILLVAVAMNWFSRSQVKAKAGTAVDVINVIANVIDRDVAWDSEALKAEITSALSDDAES